MTLLGRWVELVSTVINVCWRNNPNLLAKQLESVDRLSGARLIAMTTRGVLA